MSEKDELADLRRISLCLYGRDGDKITERFLPRLGDPTDDELRSEFADLGQRCVKQVRANSRRHDDADSTD